MKKIKKKNLKMIQKQKTNHNKNNFSLDIAIQKRRKNK